MMRRFTSDWWLGAAMGATLLVLAVLIWQSLAAARSHLAISQQVLSDYAALAAENFARQIKSTVGYWAAHRIGQVVGRSDVALEERLAQARRDAALQPTSQGEQLLAALDAIDAIWVVRADQAPACLVGTCSGSFDADWLEARLPSSIDPPGFIFRHRVSPDGVYTAVIFAREDGGHLGVEYGPDRLENWLATVADAGELLPTVLAKSSDLRLHLRLETPGGRTVFDQGGPSDPYLVGQRTLDDDYGELFDGFIVEAGLPGALAPQLVIGGLPRSRLPLLLLLTVLTAGLLAAVFRLLWRERQVTRLREEFVARVSHELRTPLTQIRMFAETLLLDRERDPRTARLYLRIIDREARRLAHLVDNVLLFSAARRPTSSPVSIASVPLRDLLSEIATAFEPIATGAGAKVSLEVRGEPIARADPQALRQVLLNLLDNASKYGPEGQLIRILSEADDNGCRITITDQGPGIPPRHRARIWQPFERLDRDDRRARHGTGIGLAVCRELLDAMNGHYQVDDGPDGGAAFRIELPGEDRAHVETHTAG